MNVQLFQNHISAGSNSCMLAAAWNLSLPYTTNQTGHSRTVICPGFLFPLGTVSWINQAPLWASLWNQVSSFWSNSYTVSGQDPPCVLCFPFGPGLCSDPACLTSQPMAQQSRPLKMLKLRPKLMKVEVKVSWSSRLPGAGEEEAQQRLTEWKRRTPEFAPEGDWLWNILN